MQKNKWISYVASLCVFLGTGIFGVLNYQKIEREMAAPTLELLAKSNFNFLSAMVIDDIVLEDKNDLDAFIEQALSHDWGIRMIRFEDRDGHVLGEWEDKIWPKIQAKLEKFHTTAMSGYYYLNAPVEIQGEKFGSISIGYDFRSIEKFTQERQKKMMSLALIVFVSMGIGIPAPFLVYDNWHLFVLVGNKVKEILEKFKKKKAE